MIPNLHPIIAQALARWTPPTEAQWAAADLEAVRRKNADPFHQAEADAAMRRELDFDQMQRSFKS